MMIVKIFQKYTTRFKKYINLYRAIYRILYVYNNQSGLLVYVLLNRRGVVGREKARSSSQPPFPPGWIGTLYNFNDDVTGGKVQLVFLLGVEGVQSFHLLHGWSFGLKGMEQHTHDSGSE